MKYKVTYDPYDDRTANLFKYNVEYTDYTRDLGITNLNSCPEVSAWFKARGLKYLRDYEWGWRHVMVFDKKNIKKPPLMVPEIYVEFKVEEHAIEFKLSF